MRRFADIILTLAALLALASCTDETDAPQAPSAAKGNLCVYVPVTRADGGQDALDNVSGSPTYNATVDECQVNDLWLYAFPVEGDGTLLSQKLVAPSAASMVDEQTASYQLQIEPGKYRVYVVANMGDMLQDAGITTEDALKDVVLNYTPMGKPGMPVAANIPMIYEPATQAADGTATDGITVVKASDTNAAVVMANLRFTCVKVRLNLIFDPSAEGVDAALKQKGICVGDIVGRRLSPSAPLVWGQKFTNPDLADGSEYANGLERTLYDYVSATETGRYYSAWTENNANANENDKDIVNVEGEGTAAPTDITSKWLFQTTCYLPERYVAKAAQQSQLKIGGLVGGTTDNTYTVNLGHRRDESSQTEVPTFPRGTYYEIVGRIKTLGNIGLDCIVGVKDWTPAAVEADFTHTTLWVSSTKASVTSLQNAYIDYRTNAASVEFGCDSKINGNDIIILANNDIANHRVFFQVNHDIPVSAYGSETHGTAKAWIKVNNLKKYIDVEYDVEPLFRVSPVDITIFYDNDDQTENKKVLTFLTNLGGLNFPDGWSSGKVLYAGNNNASQINVEYGNTAVSSGTFTVTAITDPGTTTVHTFTVTSRDGSRSQLIRVTVKQKFGPYRIYMRAINDLVWGKAIEASNNMKAFSAVDQLDESDDILGSVSPNWRDGWIAADNVAWGNDMNESCHYAYVYTQIGETQNANDPDNQPVWRFTASYPGNKLTGDLSNPGWYYITFAEKAYTEEGNGMQTGGQYIKPGQTLIIFSNNSNMGPTRHRFPHHMDAGMTLFNYEDHEGWYVYDPTTEPYYKVYDDKPDIVDIKYTVYSRYEIKGWYHTYGVNSNDPADKAHYTIYCNTHRDGHFTSSYSNGWWTTVIWLKAPKNDNEKAIQLNFNSNSAEPTLNNGAPFETMTKSGNFYVVETTYDNGKWTEGDHR